MKAPTLFIKITRAIVLLVIFYVLMIKAATSKEELVVVDINGENVTMSKSQRDNLMQRSQDALKRLKAKEELLNGPAYTHQRLKDLDEKTKKELDKKIKQIDEIYNDFINNKDAILLLLTGKEEVKRQPGESPREFQARKDQFLQMFIIESYNIGIAMQYAHKVKKLDILSLELQQKMMMHNSCDEMIIQDCEKRGGFFVYECIRNSKKCDQDYFDRRRVSSIPRSNSHGSKLNAVIDVIDILGDIDKVDYASDGYTALMRAAVKNNVKKIEALVTQGANINFKTAIKGEIAIKGKTALMVAAERKQLNAISALIKHGANMDIKNSNGESALFYAKNDFNVFKTLVDNGADIESRNKQGQTVLFNFLENSSNKKHALQRIKIIKYLIKIEVNLDAKDNKGMTPLLYAVGEKNKEAVEIIIESGADANVVDDKGNTALHIIAVNSKRLALLDPFMKLIYDEFGNVVYGNVENSYVITDYLIKQGVNVDIQNNMGVTALMNAVNYEAVYVVDALIDNNANVNLTLNDLESGPKTALQGADSDVLALKIINHPLFDVNLKHHQQALNLLITHRMLEAADALIEKGVDVNVRGVYTRTPLISAVMVNEEAYIRKLLALGADKELADMNNRTALNYAKQYGHGHLYHLLE